VRADVIRIRLQEENLSYLGIADKQYQNISIKAVANCRKESRLVAAVEHRVSTHHPCSILERQINVFSLINSFDSHMPREVEYSIL
jgi:hypothetical protein